MRTKVKFYFRKSFNKAGSKPSSCRLCKLTGITFSLFASLSLSLSLTRTLCCKSITYPSHFSSIESVDVSHLFDRKIKICINFQQTSVVSLAVGNPATGCPGHFALFYCHLRTNFYQFCNNSNGTLHFAMYNVRASECWQICKLTSSCVLRFIETSPHIYLYI